MPKIKKDWFIDFYNDPTISAEFKYPEFDVSLFKKNLNLNSLDGMKIFDQCCGFGRVIKCLSVENVKIFGCDISKHGIDLIKHQHPETEVELKDARVYIPPCPCDLAINIYSSFPYFKEDAENEKIIKNLFLSLKKGGRMYLETLDSEYIAQNFKKIMRIGSFIRESTLVHKGIIQRWSKDGQLVQESYIRLYTQIELKTMIGKYFIVSKFIKENGRLTFVGVK